MTLTAKSPAVAKCRAVESQESGPVGRNEGNAENKPSKVEKGGQKEDSARIGALVCRGHIEAVSQPVKPCECGNQRSGDSAPETDSPCEQEAENDERDRDPWRGRNPFPASETAEKAEKKGRDLLRG